MSKEAEKELKTATAPVNKLAREIAALEAKMAPLKAALEAKKEQALTLLHKSKCAGFKGDGFTITMRVNTSTKYQEIAKELAPNGVIPNVLIEKHTTTSAPYAVIDGPMIKAAKVAPAPKRKAA